jgi:hypothetical protein
LLTKRDQRYLFFLFLSQKIERFSYIFHIVFFDKIEKIVKLQEI